MRHHHLDAIGFERSIIDFARDMINRKTLKRAVSETIAESHVWNNLERIARPGREPERVDGNRSSGGKDDDARASSRWLVLQLDQRENNCWDWACDVAALACFSR